LDAEVESKVDGDWFFGEATQVNECMDMVPLVKQLHVIVALCTAGAGIPGEALRGFSHSCLPSFAYPSKKQTEFLHAADAYSAYTEHCRC
jgi:hypothetical protein